MEAVRTPIGRSHPERGWFRDTHPNAMLGACLHRSPRRHRAQPGGGRGLIVGCTAPFGEQSRNIARNAWLQAGYPPEVPAIGARPPLRLGPDGGRDGGRAGPSGTHDLVIAGGVEHMGHVPMNSPAEDPELYGDPWPQELRDRYEFVPQGESAELIAEQWDISREEMDEFAVRSHALAAAAIAGRRVRRGDDPARTRRRDPGQRPGHPPGHVARGLAALKPVFRPERPVTAGSRRRSRTAPPRCCSPAGAAERYGLRPRARILDQTTVGVDPVIMLTGPIPATRKLLDRNGLTIDDIDLIEINEAFASVVLAWERELKPDMDRVNVNGGAIALGHPVGATGARLIATILAELERRDAELGLVTMCCGGGLGTATLVQRLIPA